MDGSPPPSGSRARAAWIAVLLGVVALVPSLGTWSAPPLAEDAAILGYVHAEPPGSDALGSQYGLSTLRFWRPLVTLGWDLQESLGLDPRWLRSLNLAAHVLATLLVARLARQLGLGTVGAVTAGVFAATFPAQGGTVTWLAGRTDGTVGPWMLLALSLALDGRRGLACAATALACATKEMAFLLPAWVMLFSWARRPGRGRFLREALPVVLTCLAVLGLRRILLGAWIGGYPRTAGTTGLPLVPVVGAFVRAQLPTLLATAVLVVAALRFRPPGRVLLASLGAALVGGLPLVGLLADGVLEPQNLRTLRVADLALALLPAAALAATSRPAAGNPPRAWWMVLAPAALGLLAVRGVGAWNDTRAWARSADEAAAWEADVRERLVRLRAGDQPVLVPGIRRSTESAYHLGFGVADRFRAPFAPAPRPVWPLRTVFEGTAEAVPAHALLEGFLVPEAELLVDELEVEIRGSDGRLRDVLELDAAVAVDPDRTPRVEVLGGRPGLVLAACLYTEIGYQVVPLPEAATTLRRIVLAGDGVFSIGDAWYLAADVGRGLRAALEIRAHDPGTGELVAASAFLPVVWTAGLVGRLPDPYASLRW